MNHRWPTLILVGECPPKENRDACLGQFAQKLEKVSGVTHGDYIAHTIRTNLFEVPPDHWSRGRAEEQARMMLEGKERRALTIVLFGNRVHDAFARWLPLKGMNFLDCRQVGPLCVYFFPHPSGLNHWWNDPYHRAVAGELFKRLVSEEAAS